ncbi:ABC transporter permease [Achromobacter sp. NPDC058515]|uniref:ABC transporter permease n=1 Tax=Achromobacter sp. NPDC058515 TaxID=3346533 RepID=UPI00364C7623
MKKRSSFAIAKTVIFALSLREIRARLNAKRLGAFWILFEPIAHVLGMVLIIAGVRGRNIPGLDVVIFLLTGIVPFLLFKNICLKLMEAVSSNKALFSYKQIRPADALVARMVVECALFVCLYALLMASAGFLAGADISISHPLEWIGILLVGIAMSFAIGVVLCVVGEAAPELKTFFRLMFLPMYMMSGVVYPIWALPGSVLSWLMWNPFLHLIDMLRWAVFPYYPDTAGVNPFYPLKVTIVLVFIATGLYRVRRMRLVAL